MDDLHQTVDEQRPLDEAESIGPELQLRWAFFVWGPDGAGGETIVECGTDTCRRTAVVAAPRQIERLRHPAPNPEEDVD